MESIKNLRSSDNVKNNTLRHTIADYRIACAIQNFKHKPIETDGVNAKTYFKKLLRLSIIEENSLEILLSFRSNNRVFKRTSLNEIEDFPALDVSELKDRLFLGSFILSLVKSYMSDLIQTQDIFLITKESIDRIRDEDLQFALKESFECIFAPFIKSRHQSQKLKTYKVFIKYPEFN